MTSKVLQDVKSTYLQLENWLWMLQCAAQAKSSVPKHSCKSLENRVVSQGIRLPLEVFKTLNGRGWGVRCAEPIEIGTFICDYVGRLITDPQAVSPMLMSAHLQVKPDALLC